MAVTGREIERLYREHSRRLRRIVGVDVRASDATVEDACQVAWGRLLAHGHRVGAERALPWLVTTAVREAVKLTRVTEREPSLEEALDRSGDAAVPGHTDEAADRLEFWARLAELEELPRRQRRLLWLQGLGLTYGEMADHEGCTPRTVERQLLRAKRLVRDERLLA